MTDEAPNMVATPERIASWLAIAEAGAELVYASRCGMMAGGPGARAAREAAALGLVELFQRPIRGRPERNYVARRTAVPLPAPTPAGAPRAEEERGHVDGEARTIDALMRLLTRAARFGRPCPTDAALGRRIGCGAGEIKRVMDAMARMNLIRVSRAPAPTLRQVTIVNRGYRTGIIG